MKLYKPPLSINNNLQSNIYKLTITTNKYINHPKETCSSSMFSCIKWQPSHLLQKLRSAKFTINLCSSFHKFFEMPASATHIGSFCHWAYNLHCHSYLYQNESPPPCFRPDSSGVFDPEMPFTMFQKQQKM